MRTIGLRTAWYVLSWSNTGTTLDLRHVPAKRFTRPFFDKAFEFSGDAAFVLRSQNVSTSLNRFPVLDDATARRYRLKERRASSLPCSECLGDQRRCGHPLLP